MQKSDKIKRFDPNGIGQTNNQIFGLPFNYEDSEIIVIPVPWDLTTSYLSGTAFGPQAVFDYSPQIDLFDFDVPNAWQMGIFMLPISDYWLAENKRLRPKAEKYLDFLEKTNNPSLPMEMQQILKEINQSCFELKTKYKEITDKVLKDGKLPCILGGDHSTPLALMESLGEKYDSFGILQIDAHADLRVAYEGFELSHASIMHNALNIPAIDQLVSVGVRDLCELEFAAAENDFRITAFYDKDLKKAQFTNEKGWNIYCQEIIESLPQNVYVSFDIDGLCPEFCPNTGTPVPGGLTFSEAIFLLNTLVDSGRQIIGFDLSEVSVGGANATSSAAEYNANVGSRVLYKLCNLMGKSQGIIN